MEVEEQGQETQDLDDIREIQISSSGLALRPCLSHLTLQVVAVIAVIVRHESVTTVSSHAEHDIGPEEAKDEDLETDDELQGHESRQGALPL